MKRKNSTRNALFTSIISLLLCVSMLVGATFAWFTDKVESGTNTIAAGNLDVELYYSKTKDFSDEKKVDGQTLLFTDKDGKEIKYWEPGVVAYTNLQVANVGSLALKYQMSVNFTNETKVNGHGLSEALKVAVVEGGFVGDRAAAQALTNLVPLESFVLPGVLEGDTKSEIYGVVIYWEPTANDNLFNMNNENQGKTLSIDLGINLFATQEMYESDSFGEDYDKLAPWTGNVNTEWYDADPTAAEFTITSAEELAGLAQLVNSGADTFKNKTVKLAANIDLNDASWTPIGNNDNGWNNKFNGSFIGTGYTIYNLYVVGTSGVGLFGYVGSSAHIEGVTIDGAFISGNDYVGAVMGSGYLAANCLKNNTVKNAQIVAMPFLKADGVTYDGGAKAGAVAGYALNGNIIGNKVSNCTVMAFRDLGSIVGMISGSDWGVIVSQNTVDTVTLTYVNMNGAPMYENKVNENMGDVAGRTGGDVTIADDNTTTNVTRETVITYTDNGVQYIKDVDAGDVLLYAVTEDAPAVLDVPQGVTTLRAKILNGNTAIKEVILPATVTDFGGTPNATGTGASGGMFYNSAVEKITLSEGMTEIPVAAFNQASNLKSVNIPASVKKIGINAFAGSGLETLTVPATVEEIGYGAFRDMVNLTTVTIESATDIPLYAFRACTNLEHVFLTSEDVTFGGGGRNMIFCNESTGNGTAITVYVASEAVKDRLVAADTAATNYGGYKIIIAEDGGYYMDEIGNAVVNDDEALVAALEDKKNVVIYSDTKIEPASMSNAYGTTGINVKNGQTIDGGGHVLDIKGAGGTWDSGINTTGGVIKNIIVTGSFRGIFINHNSDHSEKVVLENVIIKGTTYTISCDQGTGKGLEATNCTFNGWTSYAATIGDVKFVDSSFGEGNGYAYCRPYAPTEFVGCDFEAGFKVDPRAAVTFENCTFAGEPLTAENLSILVTNVANASIK